MQKLTWGDTAGAVIGTVVGTVIVLGVMISLAHADSALDAAEFQYKYYVERDARLKAEFRINTIDMETAKQELIKLRKAAAQAAKKAKESKASNNDDSQGSGEE